MCLAIPVRIERTLDDERAVASVGGIEREINVSLVENLQTGDYVILHVGFALSRVDEQEAQATLQLMSEAGLLEEGIDEIRG
jgi:hydrogenase expression/formation protein HypC